MSNAALNLRLKQYLEAEATILAGGQSYTIGNRTLTRADLKQIRLAIDDLLAAGATADDTAAVGNKRSRQVLFRD